MPFDGDTPPDMPGPVPAFQHINTSLFFRVDQLEPDDFAGEQFTQEHLKFLAGLVLPVVPVPEGADDSDFVVVSALDIAKVLEMDARPGVNRNASFWEGMHYEDALRRKRNFDPALGDVGRVIRFPVRTGELIRDDK